MRPKSSSLKEEVAAVVSEGLEAVEVSVMKAALDERLAGGDLDELELLFRKKLAAIKAALDEPLSREAYRSSIRTAFSLAVARSRTEQADLDELEDLFRRIDLTAKEHPSLHARLQALVESGDLTAAHDELERFERADRKEIGGRSKNVRGTQA